MTVPPDQAVDLGAVPRIAAPERWLAVVSVARSDGSVHASLVNAGVLDHPATGTPIVAFVARGDARKLVHLRRTGLVTVTFHHGWEWAAVEGTAELAGPDDPSDLVAPGDLPTLLRQVFQSAGGTHDDWDEYDRVMAAERRTAVLVTPRRVLTNRTG